MVQASMVEADPGCVYISVSDTGRGISPEAKALIFERLYQDPDSVDNNRSGLGLGLFICREIVRLHEGRIWVSSELGPGQHLHLHSAHLLPGQAACPGHHLSGSFAAGFCAGEGRTHSALQSSAGQLEGNLAAVFGDPAAVRLSRQRSGPAADGDGGNDRDFFCRGLDRPAALRDHDHAHSRATGARWAISKPNARLP